MLFKNLLFIFLMVMTISCTSSSTSENPCSGFYVKSSLIDSVRAFTQQIDPQGNSQGDFRGYIVTLKESLSCEDQKAKEIFVENIHTGAGQVLIALAHPEHKYKLVNATLKRKIFSEKNFERNIFIPLSPTQLLLVE